MEPFELTLQQVTFEEGEYSPQPELDSFDTVVNYDTHFESSIGTTFQGTSALSYSYTDAHRSRVTNQFSRPSIRAQPSQVKTTQIYTKLVCSDGVSAGLLHQHNLIHPDSCLRDTSYITRKDKITDSDIRTLFKVFMIVV